MRTWEVNITDRPAFRVNNKTFGRPDSGGSGGSGVLGCDEGVVAQVLHGEVKVDELVVAEQCCALSRGLPYRWVAPAVVVKCDTETVTRDPEARAASGVSFAAEDFIRLGSINLTDVEGALAEDCTFILGQAGNRHQEQMCDLAGCVGFTTLTPHWVRVRRGQHT